MMNAPSALPISPQSTLPPTMDDSVPNYIERRLRSPHVNYPRRTPSLLPERNVNAGGSIFNSVPPADYNDTPLVYSALEKIEQADFEKIILQDLKVMNIFHAVNSLTITLKTLQQKYTDREFPLLEDDDGVSVLAHSMIQEGLEFHVMPVLRDYKESNILSLEAEHQPIFRSYPTLKLTIDAIKYSTLSTEHIAYIDKIFAAAHDLEMLASYLDKIYKMLFKEPAEKPNLDDRDNKKELDLKSMREDIQTVASIQKNFHGLFNIELRKPQNEDCNFFLNELDI